MENNIKLLLLDRMLVLMKTCRRGRSYIVTYIVPYDICTCKCKIHNTILVHMNDPLYMFNRHIMAVTGYHRNITEILKTGETVLYILSYSYKSLNLRTSSPCIDPLHVRLVLLLPSDRVAAISPVCGDPNETA